MVAAVSVDWVDYSLLADSVRQILVQWPAEEAKRSTAVQTMSCCPVTYRSVELASVVCLTKFNMIVSHRIIYCIVFSCKRWDRKLKTEPSSSSALQ